MTDWRPRYHIGITSVLRRCGLAAVLGLSMSGVVSAQIAERLSNYFEGCAGALLKADVVPFADLDVETEKDTSAEMVRLWRGKTEPDLTVLLSVKIEGGQRNGFCDITYLPAKPNHAEMAKVVGLPNQLANAVMDDPSSKLEMSPSSWIILTCTGDHGLGYYFDSKVQWRGFSVQVSTVSSRRIKCEG